MSEFEKLRHGHDFAAELLRSGANDAPSVRARNAAENALGLTLTTGAATAVTTHAASAATTTAGLLGKQSAWVLAKWFGLGIVAGTAAGGGLALESARTPATKGKTAVLSSDGPMPRADAHRFRASASADMITPKVEPALSTASAHPGAASAEVARPASVHAPDEGSLRAAPSANITASALSRELTLLERARKKVRIGDGRGALAELDTIAPEIHALATEAALLRVEALLENGERTRAEELAAELEQRSPAGSQSFRLKRLLATP